MTISTIIEENIADFLNEHSGEANLIETTKEKFAVSHSSVYRIAYRNGILITKNPRIKRDIVELTSQEKILYSMLQQITKVRKTKSGQIRVRKNDGTYIPIVELMKTS